MELKILHFYPDLMSLYGSYANVSILKRTLEEMGNTVTVERVELGGDADLPHADFAYMGAGTERAQKAALLYFSPARHCGHLPPADRRAYDPHPRYAPQNRRHPAQGPAYRQIRSGQQTHGPSRTEHDRRRAGGPGSF